MKKGCAWIFAHPLSFQKGRESTDEKKIEIQSTRHYGITDYVISWFFYMVTTNL